MSLTYPILIYFPTSDLNPSFDGYFEVDGTNIITSFYTASSPGTNLLMSFQGNHTFSGTDIIDTYLTHDAFPPGNNIYFEGADYYVIDGDSVTQEGGSFLNVLTVIGEPSCFNEGTKILCLKNNEEEYVPVEQLNKGDVVKSYKYGYRKIDLIGKNQMVNKPDNFKQCMYTMKKTDTNNLLEDLTVTGGHSILVDELGEDKEKNEDLFNGLSLMIEDKHLLLAAVSSKFEKVTNNDKYTYYHFCLENNGNDDEIFGVWANGVLTETPSKNFLKKSLLKIL